MTDYVAIIHKDADSDFGVSFPDLPGCVTAGRDLEEAREMAEEALALHLEGLAADGTAAPTPSTLDTVMRDAVNRQGVAVLVAATDPGGVPLDIRLPEGEVRAIDAYARRHGMTRAAFLAAAVREKLEDLI